MGTRRSLGGIRLGALAAAAALIPVLASPAVAAPAAPMAVAATTSTPPAALDLPWTAIGATATVVDVLSTPARAILRPVLDASAGVPVVEVVARPAQQVLGLVDAGLPLAIEGSALAGTLTGDWPAVDRLDDADVPAWQVSELPDVSADLARVGARIDDLRASLDDVVACDCLWEGATKRLDELRTDTENASWALDAFGPLLPEYDALAGFDGPRTYLLVIGNQAEMRPSGGAPLYAAIVTADDGLVRIEDKGATSTHFFPPLNRPVTWTGPDGNPYFADNPRTQPFVNAGANPDFTVTGPEMAAAFQAGGYPEVDGVIFVDLTLLQEVMRLTGPVDVEGLGRVEADTLITRLLDHAYDNVDSVEEHQRRQAANDALFDTLLARVSAGMPALATLRVIQDSVDRRHLQTWFRDDGTQDAFDDRDWTGRLTAPATGDWLAWYTQNGNPSKTDTKQRRSVVRTVEIDADSARVSSAYEIANDNSPRIDEGADERRGYQATWMRTAVVAYLPNEATNVGVAGLVNMKVAPLPGAESVEGVMTDGSGNRFLRFVGWIPPLERARIEVSYELPADNGTYTLTMEPQSAITPFDATVTVLTDAGASEVFGPAAVIEQTTVGVP